MGRLRRPVALHGLVGPVCRPSPGRSNWRASGHPPRRTNAPASRELRTSLQRRSPCPQASPAGPDQREPARMHSGSDLPFQAQLAIWRRYRSSANSKSGQATADLGRLRTPQRLRVVRADGASHSAGGPPTDPRRWRAPLRRRRGGHTGPPSRRSAAPRLDRNGDHTPDWALGVKPTFFGIIGYVASVPSPQEHDTGAKHRTTRPACGLRNGGASHSAVGPPTDPRRWRAGLCPRRGGHAGPPSTRSVALRLDRDGNHIPLRVRQAQQETAYMPPMPHLQGLINESLHVIREARLPTGRLIRRGGRMPPRAVGAGPEPKRRPVGSRVPVCRALSGPPAVQSWASRPAQCADTESRRQAGLFGVPVTWHRSCVGSAESACASYARQRLTDACASGEVRPPAPDDLGRLRTPQRLRAVPRLRPAGQQDCPPRPGVVETAWRAKAGPRPRDGLQPPAGPAG
jgi:hypothetical protein